jgi:beta-mannosidase
MTASSRIALSEGWILSGPRGIRLAATVPGCVHTDLLSAGVIPDPYLLDNEERVSWIGHEQWSYEADIQAPHADRVDLVCEGLDTVATISVNGEPVAQTANMHRAYRFPVTELMRHGGSRLRVTFDSAIRYAEEQRDRLGDRPRSYPQPYNFVRKMACNFGWDWGPSLVTAGIWRPAWLHCWSIARLAQVRPAVTVDRGTGIVELHLMIERTRELPLVVTAEVDGVRAVARLAGSESTANLRLAVPHVARWWPHGIGDPARYALTVTLSTVDGEPLDRWRRAIGFRTVRVDTTPDADGTPFVLLINDRPVFVRGANWIPDDAFPSRVDASRYARRLSQAVAANVNLLRVWGGGTYESRQFYQTADQLGLLVQQDFAFACAAYPEEEPFRGEVEAEARDNVLRLAPHPSLVLWTGNNENHWGHRDWGWVDELDGKSWGRGYYNQLLPGIVAELDPTRPYWPGSPYSGSEERHPNDPAHGTTHIWDVWNSRDYSHYRSYRPRFVAEFGYQGPPAYATLRRALPDGSVAPDTPGMARRQKAPDGQDKIARGLAEHLPPPGDADDWHYLAQVNQARAIRVGVEHFRSLKPLCMGTIVWQLNDCWPVIAWSAVDGDGRLKPMWHALREAYADRLITFQPHDAGVALVTVNDTAQAWRERITVTRRRLDGVVCAAATIDVVTHVSSAIWSRLPENVVTAGDPASELLLAEAPGRRAWWFFAEDRDIAFPPAAFDADVVPTSDGYAVTLAARSILRDLVVQPDRLNPDATVDRSLVTLLPGEKVTFQVRSPAPLDPAALLTRPVLRCVNDRVAGDVPRRPAG